MLAVISWGATHAVAAFVALVMGAADTACAESSYDYADGAVVLHVVAERATTGPRRGWSRYDGTLSGALWSPAQHAHGCRAPLTWRHVRLGVEFATGRLDVPDWAKDAWYYCGKYDRPGACEARGAVLPLGHLSHTFWR